MEHVPPSGIMFVVADASLLQELLPHRKQGPGFLTRMGETVRAVANSVRGPRNRPEEFALMQDYAEDFSNKISSVDKVTQRIIKEQRGSLGGTVRPCKGPSVLRFYEIQGV